MALCAGGVLFSPRAFFKRVCWLGAVLGQRRATWVLCVGGVLFSPRTFFKWVCWLGAVLGQRRATWVLCAGGVLFSPRTFFKWVCLLGVVLGQRRIGTRDTYEFRLCFSANPLQQKKQGPATHKGSIMSTATGSAVPSVFGLCLLLLIC